MSKNLELNRGTRSYQAEHHNDDTVPDSIGYSSNNCCEVLISQNHLVNISCKNYECTAFSGLYNSS